MIAMTAPTKRRIFMLGIAGTGMRGLAYLLHEKGNVISGSDVTADALAELVNYETALEGIAFSLVERADVLVYTDAAPNDHPLRKLARDKGISEMSYQAALGEFAEAYEVIAVAGTHGKSSTSAFLAHILIEAGLDPTVLIGASCSALEGEHARLGQSSYFVVEADEYREHFLTLKPAQAIITNVDFDHPDFFKSRGVIEALFEEFAGRVAGEVITEADTEGVPAPLPGEHMKRNAALAVAMAQRLGVERTDAIEALYTFPGLKRRFEVVGSIKETDVISDYAHHPAAIVATLAGAREKYPNTRIAVIFEAHMLERLSTFFDDFVEALSQADHVLIYPPFEPEGRGAAEAVDAVARLSESLKAMSTSTEVLQDADTLPASVETLADSYDLVVAFTAGRLDGALRSIFLKKSNIS